MRECGQTSDKSGFQNLKTPLCLRKFKVNAGSDSCSANTDANPISSLPAQDLCCCGGCLPLVSALAGNRCSLLCKNVVPKPIAASHNDITRLQLQFKALQAGGKSSKQQEATATAHTPQGQVSTRLQLGQHRFTSLQATRLQPCTAFQHHNSTPDWDYVIDYVIDGKRIYIATCQHSNVLHHWMLL